MSYLTIMSPLQDSEEHLYHEQLIIPRWGYSFSKNILLPRNKFR